MEEKKDRLMLTEAIDFEVEELESRLAPQTSAFDTDVPPSPITPPNPVVPDLG